MKHICAACIPVKIPFFTYDWKQETWNLILVLGAAVGGYISITFVADTLIMVVHEGLKDDLKVSGINYYKGLLPAEVFL